MTSDACDYPTFPDPLTIFISFSILSSPPRAIARPLACKLSLRYFPVFVLPSLPLFLSHPRTRAASVFSCSAISGTEAPPPCRRPASALFLSIVLDSPSLRYASFGTLIAVIGPASFRSFPLARTDVRDTAARACIETICIGKHKSKLKGNRWKEKPVIVDLKVSSPLIIYPSQSKVRNASSSLLLPGIKPYPDFVRNGISCIR
jgi:hypothetical protein